jgi:hypothetical protein
MADTDIQITEIHYDSSPLLPYSDVVLEWVELRNDGTTAVSLDGWTITDAGGSVTSFDAGFTVQAGQYGIVYNSQRISESDFLSIYGPLPPNTVLITRSGIDTDWANLNNSGDQIILRNDSGTVIEDLTYPDIAADGQTVSVGGTDGAETFTLQNDPTPGAPVCFAAKTLIETSDGPVMVEDLQIGTNLATAEGGIVPVKWIGRQTVSTRFGPAERLMPVRFAAGSLGEGLPHTDLTVTADHGMLLDGVICHAGALVNGTTITRVPLAEMGESYTVYHIETEAHEIILANGAPAETFIDNVSRRVFDNFAEFEALYGDVPEMEELPYPRAMSARQVPGKILQILANWQVA